MEELMAGMMAEEMQRAVSMALQDGHETVSNQCHNCGEISCDAMSFCGNCRVASHCSTRCQNEHWPTHKITCKQQTQSMLTDDKKQSNELLTQWSEQADLSLHFFCCSALHADELQETLSRPLGESSVLIAVDFDCNFQTFKPTGPPLLLSRDEAGSTTHQAGFRQRMDPTATEKRVVTVIIKHGSATLFLPITVIPLDLSVNKECKNDSWEDLCASFEGITLASSVSKNLDPGQQRANIGASLENIQTHNC